jgi:transposase InsO family protein
VDYYGALPESRSRVTYIFVVIDAFSKFVRLYPLRRAQAKISAKKITDDFHRFIPVKVVLSDHGTQFQSPQWQDTLRNWGIQPTLSTIRRLQSNPTERVMKELSRLFRTYCPEFHSEIGIISTHREKIGFVGKKQQENF